MRCVQRPTVAGPDSDRFEAIMGRAEQAALSGDPVSLEESSRDLSHWIESLKNQNASRDYLDYIRGRVARFQSLCEFAAIQLNTMFEQVAGDGERVAGAYARSGDRSENTLSPVLAKSYG